MTLILSERDVEALLEMKQVVASVEEAFRQEGMGQATNSPRTRSARRDSTLNVMHANLQYLRRGGLKAYMSSAAGAKFVVILFDSSNSAPLAVMGADILGRFRTGAASGVATKHLYAKSSGTLGVMGSGKQALTQVLAVNAVMNVDRVRVWSPQASHRKAFAQRLVERGFDASAADTPDAALKGAQVACAITSSAEPFLTNKALGSISLLNICGGNVPTHAEITSNAVGSFDTVVVDHLPQAKVEYGDLIQAVHSGDFEWESAFELGSVVAGKHRPKGRTLFKSGGVALEDVAVASMLYDKAVNSGKRYPNVEMV